MEKNDRHRTIITRKFNGVSGNTGSNAPGMINYIFPPPPELSWEPSFEPLPLLMPFLHKEQHLFIVSLWRGLIIEQQPQSAQSFIAENPVCREIPVYFLVPVKYTEGILQVFYRRLPLPMSN